MAFHVEISPEAFDNLDAISNYNEARSSFRVAERWFNGILDAIRSLNEMPYRCPVTEESADFASEVRMLLYGKQRRRYKIYFAIDEETKSVRVFHVRHWL